MADVNITSEEQKKQTEELEDFVALLKEKEEHENKIKEGEIVKGKVVAIQNDRVVIDIGFKSEGYIDIEEFKDLDGEIKVKPGDEVDVYVEMLEDAEGNCRLSKEKADKLKRWQEIMEICEKEGIVEGTIISRVKGGLSVDIGIKAFLPGSQVDLRPVHNLDKLIGQKFKFKVIKFNKKRNNIVLSRRALLEEEREAKKRETLAKLKEGAVLKGVIKNITDYGAFVDLGGIDGLLHITDMSWGRINHPSEKFKVGDEIDVCVLKYDPKTERVSLGLKQLTEDPWTKVPEKYPPGTKVKGKVVRLENYGAFIELEEGVDGLVHNSEMSWTKRIRHPSQEVQVGDIVEAVVLSIDPEKRKISLGMKQVEPNPWAQLKEKYPPGTKVRGKVRNITDFGIFIGIEEGIDGLVHISDISWTNRVKHPSELFEIGQEVEAVVLKIDEENHRFSLSIKDLSPDPWAELIPSKYRVGTSWKGKVKKLTDFGAFVELEEGVEGLVHVSEISDEHVKDPREVLKEGQEVTVKVISLDPEKRQIGLSIRSAGEPDEYVNEQAEEASTNLGELLSAQLKELAQPESSEKKD